MLARALAVAPRTTETSVDRALATFLDRRNTRVVEAAVCGLHVPARDGTFDPVNERYGLRGDRRVTTFADAFRACLCGPQKRDRRWGWDLTLLDLQTLRECAAGALDKLRMPSAVYDAEAVRRWNERTEEDTTMDDEGNILDTEPGNERIIDVCSDCGNPYDPEAGCSTCASRRQIAAEREARAAAIVAPPEGGFSAFLSAKRATETEIDFDADGEKLRAAREAATALERKKAEHDAAIAEAEVNGRRRAASKPTTPRVVPATSTALVLVRGEGAPAIAPSVAPPAKRKAKAAPSLAPVDVPNLPPLDDDPAAVREVLKVWRAYQNRALFTCTALIDAWDAGISEIEPFYDENGVPLPVAYVVSRYACYICGEKPEAHKIHQPGSDGHKAALRAIIYRRLDDLWTAEEVMAGAKAARKAAAMLAERPRLTVVP